MCVGVSYLRIPTGRVDGVTCREPQLVACLAAAARAVVLASLADVDMVVPFSEQTPLQMIKALQPDVLVKGADYTIETVVGADLVQGYGGKIVLARLEPGHSTSGIFARAVGIRVEP